jgi:hypothetical protein
MVALDVLLDPLDEIVVALGANDLATLAVDELAHRGIPFPDASVRS